MQTGATWQKKRASPTLRRGHSRRVRILNDRLESLQILESNTLSILRTSHRSDLKVINTPEMLDPVFWVDRTNQFIYVTQTIGLRNMRIVWNRIVVGHL